MHVSPDEQLRRFESRAKDDLRRWKLTDEDWRNRDKRTQYEQAVDDMLARTDQPKAPWIVVAADHKPTARALVVEQVCERIDKALAGESLRFR